MASAPGVDESTPLLAELTVEQYCTVPVYPLIHEIRLDVVAHIDTPLTVDQLLAPDSTYTIIRPLTEKYLLRRNPSVVFCLLLNKVQFTSDSSQLSISTLSESRAALCEILAIRVLRGWSERSLHLATVLLTPWPMFQGAPEDVVIGVQNDGEEEMLGRSGTAMEMAIISTSKRLIRSPSCQKVIEGIWSGKIVYSSLSTHALIQDNYKKRPIQMYNPHKAPLLDHYRLKVPKIRAIIEYANFLCLFVLYIIAIENIEIDYMNTPEIIFAVYAVAFSLDKLAAIREHGLKVFNSSLVNGFDMVFVIIFAVYLGLRLIGLSTHNHAKLAEGADVLAIGAVLMFPRFAFMTLANNLMILSIRSMLVEFFFLMSVGMFCFLGFVYALMILGRGEHPLSQICWWLLEIYFGLDATGFEQSTTFNKYMGPVLMVVYGFLSNTLLLTVCVAILGNTFATINADAAAESMFRKAVATVEGVKADSVFSYQLPFNIIAVLVLYPLSFVLNPRWFHKVNVLMIRATNLPVLLIIALYERHTYQHQQETLWEQICDLADHYVGKITAATGFEGIVGTRMDVSHVFEIEEEFGTAYKNWDDDYDEEEDDQCALYDDDEEEDSDVEEGNNHPTIAQKVTLSPTDVSFDQSGNNTPHTSPVTSFTAARRRQSSLVASHAHAGIHHPTAPSTSPTAPVAPPFARARRNSAVMGPSPLAQLFVRHAVDQLAAPVRRGTIAVGSLPVSSSMGALSHSPRARNRMSFGGAAVAPAAGPIGLSTSLSVSSLAERTVPKAARPSVTPIDEHPPTTPVACSPKTPTSARPSRVPFPTAGSDAGATPSPRPAARVTFNEPPLTPREALARSSSVSSVTSSAPSGVAQSITSPPTGTRLLPSEQRPTSTLFPSDTSLEKVADKSTDKPDKPDKPVRPLPTPIKPMSSPRLKPKESPNPNLRVPSDSKLKTASQLLEAHESHVDTGAQTQIADMAARQMRIEQMLEQLLANQAAGDSGVSAVAGGVTITPRRAVEQRDTFDDLE